jgi:hypothetical protein
VADFNLNGLPQFPNGTSVKAFPLSNWNGASYAGAAPVGSEDATATVTAGVAAFTGLDADTSYVAYAEVSSEHRYKRFSTLRSQSRGEPIVLTQADYDELTPRSDTVYVVVG